jgi:hypothetical protein
VWDGTIRLTDAKISEATPFAFDAATDGITSHTAREVTFSSSTTGDTDGIDLFLDQARNGTLSFHSEVGSCTVDLCALGAERQRYDMGGLDMEVWIERYPIGLTDCSAALEMEIEPNRSQTTPYLVKAVQADGHMAWSSPIYLSAT